jgi:hypothetical protein
MASYRPRVETLEQRTLLSFAGTSGQAIVAGDFTGAGKLDLAVANNPNGPGTVSVLLGNGDGTFQKAQAYAVGTNPFSLAVGDFAGDGKLDLAVADAGSDTVSILRGNGDGTFKPSVSYPVGTYPTYIAVGDFRHNGRLDLAVGHSAQPGSMAMVSVLLNNGDGTFQPAVNYFVKGDFVNGIVVGDFTGDGKLDLAVASYFGTVSVLLGNGDGTFHPGQSFQGGFILELGALAVGDFNGDGKPDLVAFAANNPGFENSSVNVFLGNGDGTFASPISFALGNQSSFGSLAVGDFNKDGKLDVVLGDHGSGKLEVLLGHGDGTFQAGQSYVASNFGSVAVGDFNADDKLDLAATNQPSTPESSSVSILLGNGDGTFQPPHDYPLKSDTIVPAGGPAFTPDQLFVIRVYRDLLQRAPDSSGLAFFTGVLDQGAATRTQVAQAIENSQEYQTLEVSNLYQSVLRRAADPSGLNTWVHYLAQGGTAEQLRALLLGSDEYFSRFGVSSNSGYLTALYQDVLQRSLDATGAAGWGGALDAEATRTDVAAAVLESLESDTNEAEGMYQQYLHRAADPTGLQAFVNALQQGTTNEALIALMIGSDEYFAGS